MTRCAYQYHNSPCANLAVDGRRIPLPGDTGDTVTVLLCDPHCQMVDALVYSDRLRKAV